MLDIASWQVIWRVRKEDFIHTHQMDFFRAYF